MRLLALVAVFFLTIFNSPAFASEFADSANRGFYVGLEYDVYHYERPYGAAIMPGLRNILPGGLVRPLIGYRFTQNFALEAGYNDIENESRDGNDYWGPDRLRIYSYDIAGKGYLPVSDHLNVFAKAGVALTHQYVYNVVYVGNTPYVDNTTNRLQPLVGLGLSYNITKNIATDLSASYYFSTGNIGEMEMIGIGVSYTFGDL